MVMSGDVFGKLTGLGGLYWMLLMKFGMVFGLLIFKERLLEA